MDFFNPNCNTKSKPKHLWDLAYITTRTPCKAFPFCYLCENLSPGFPTPSSPAHSREVLNQQLAAGLTYLSKPISQWPVLRLHSCASQAGGKLLGGVTAFCISLLCCASYLGADEGAEPIKLLEPICPFHTSAVAHRKACWCSSSVVLPQLLQAGGKGWGVSFVFPSLRRSEFFLA